MTEAKKKRSYSIVWTLLFVLILIMSFLFLERRVSDLEGSAIADDSIVASTPTFEEYLASNNLRLECTKWHQKTYAAFNVSCSPSNKNYYITNSQLQQFNRNYIRPELSCQYGYEYLFNYTVVQIQKNDYCEEYVIKPASTPNDPPKFYGGMYNIQIVEWEND